MFHYVPLHSAPAGEKFGRFDGADVYTTAESERLVRLPMYYGLTEDRPAIRSLPRSWSSMSSKALPGWAHTLVCTAAAALVFLLVYELVCLQACR